MGQINVHGYLATWGLICDKWIGLLPVNDGDEWMKLLNSINLHEWQMVSGVASKEETLPEGGGNIITVVWEKFAIKIFLLVV